MPLFVYPERDGVALYALVAVVRGAWRYRSELAPVYWTAATVGVGVWLHAVHPRWWPVPAVLGVAATVFLAYLRRLPRVHRHVAERWPILNRRAERVWGAVLCAVTEAWLTAATIAGPGTDLLPGLAVMALLGLGCPWWWHKDRRRLVRVRRVMEHFPETAEAAGLPGARMVSAVLDSWGWTARLTLRRGQHARNAIDAVPALESALGTRVGAVRVEPVPTDAAEVVLRVVETDPHAKPIPYPMPWPDGASSAGGTKHSTPGSRSVSVAGGSDARSGSIAGPVTLGVWEDGSPVRVSLLRRHVLVGGTTGSGKSGLLNVILAELSSCRDAVLWGIDLKEGMELTPWAGCLGRLATTGKQAVELLQAGVAELERRAAWMADHGQREWMPIPSAPALVIIIDEYAELPRAARLLADSIARRGRAVAVTLLVATQRPTQKAMGEGSAIRSQMDVRICLRVTERKDVDLILGAGMLTAGWDTTGFDAPGKFLLLAPASGHDTAKRARGYLITDKQVRKVAARNQHTRNHNKDDKKGDAATAQRAADGPAAADTANWFGQTADPNTSPHSGSDGRSDGRSDGDSDGGSDGSVSGPDVALWAALWNAGDDGITVGELVTASGMSRAWVYHRLKQHQHTGHVLRTGRGRWRAAPPANSNDGNDGGGHE